MKQLCLPFNHEPCINHMAVIMANEDIANGYWDNWMLPTNLIGTF